MRATPSQAFLMFPMPRWASLLCQASLPLLESPPFADDPASSNTRLQPMDSLTADSME